MSKLDCRRWATDTLKITSDKFYINPEGQKICIDLETCSDTILFTPQDLSSVKKQVLESVKYSLENGLQSKTRIDVTMESTLSACFGLQPTDDLCLLNFASAKNPGGGFINGARAQEESISRCSALYYCLTLPQVQDYYESNRKTKDGLYTDHLIYSPHVPIFRKDSRGSDEVDDSTLLLMNVHYANIITMPAVNAGVFKKRAASGEDWKSKVDEIMRNRIDSVLSVCHKTGQKHLILGAWGCGVFRNDPNYIATLFKNFLTTKYRDVFETVIFAIQARDENDKTYQDFKTVFQEITKK